MKKLLTTAAVASALLLSPLAFAQQYYLVVPLNGGFGPSKLKENEPAEPEESSASIELQLPFGLSNDLNKGHEGTGVSHEDFVNTYYAQPFITINAEIGGGAMVYVDTRLDVYVQDRTSGEVKLDYSDSYHDLFTESGEININMPDIDVERGDLVRIRLDMDVHTHYDDDDDSFYSITRIVAKPAD